MGAVAATARPSVKSSVRNLRVRFIQTQKAAASLLTCRRTLATLRPGPLWRVPFTRNHRSRFLPPPRPLPLLPPLPPRERVRGDLWSPPPGRCHTPGRRRFRLPQDLRVRGRDRFRTRDTQCVPPLAFLSMRSIISALLLFLEGFVGTRQRKYYISPVSNMDHVERTVLRLVVGLVLMFAASGTVAQTGGAPAGALGKPGAASAVSRASAAPPQAPSRRARAATPDPRIVQALKRISPARIKATIEKLVSFHTRLSISPATPEAIAAGRGIGAAREWIQAEFERYSKDCGGCLEVKTDRFTAPPNRRIPQPTEMANVYAVLRGTDPESAKRIYLVTGHYDSRASDTLDTQSFAPGANDDASGTAVSLECARVLSNYKFPATLIFLTVAGEEQGLIGSDHFARMAREQGWQIEGVLNNDIVGGDRSPGQDRNIVRVFSE